MTLIQSMLAPLISGAPGASISLPIDNPCSTCYCNDSPTWSGPSFFPKNCATAVSQFFVQEINEHGDAVFEFLAVGGRAQSRYPPQLLPKKYTYREITCI